MGMLGWFIELALYGAGDADFSLLVENTDHGDIFFPAHGLDKFHHVGVLVGSQTLEAAFRQPHGQELTECLHFAQDRLFFTHQGRPADHEHDNDNEGHDLDYYLCL